MRLRSYVAWASRPYALVSSWPAAAGSGASPETLRSQADQLERSPRHTHNQRMGWKAHATMPRHGLEAHATQITGGTPVLRRLKKRNASDWIRTNDLRFRKRLKKPKTSEVYARIRNYATECKCTNNRSLSHLFAPLGVTSNPVQSRRPQVYGKVDHFCLSRVGSLCWMASSTFLTPKAFWNGTSRRRVLKSVWVNC